MRVFDPRKRPENHSPKKRSFNLLWLVLIVIAGGTLFAYLQRSDTKKEDNNAPVTRNQNIQTQDKTGKIKTFTGEQFKDLYNSFAYPNTAMINEQTPITGNEQADTVIKQIAVGRGYKIRSAPVTNAFKDIGEGYRLQERASEPWLQMKAAAKKDGIDLGLTAAYRSAEEQKQIFLQRLNQTGITPQGIANRFHDEQLVQVLRVTAIPGYSRHHTGYTVDISCPAEPRRSFEYTTCNQWLSADNYINAKKHGWIPSYPPDTALQGPDPESWEYVWVGVDALIE